MSAEPIRINPATVRPLAPEPPTKTSTGPAPTVDGRTFGDLLRDASTSIPGSTITWSNHATTRLAQRGIELSAAQHARLENAVDKAVAKGARDSLVLLDDNALVVSAQNRTVITALGMHQARENVFTNIDSAVIA